MLSRKRIFKRVYGRWIYFYIRIKIYFHLLFKKVGSNPFGNRFLSTFDIGKGWYDFWHDCARDKIEETNVVQESKLKHTENWYVLDGSRRLFIDLLNFDQKYERIAFSYFANKILIRVIWKNNFLFIFLAFYYFSNTHLFHCNGVNRSCERSCVLVLKHWYIHLWL